MTNTGPSTPPKSSAVDVCELCDHERTEEHADCLAKVTERKRRRQAEYAAMGIRPLLAQSRPSFLEALAHLQAASSKPIAVDESEAFEGDTWWYVPYGWIGCSGHIVDKRAGAVTRLGSSNDLSTCFWAYELGALKEPCTLVIERVHDVARAGDLLRRLDNRSPFNPVPIRADKAWLDVDAVLQSVPTRILTQSLWFALPALREADSTHAFDFRIEA